MNFITDDATQFCGGYVCAVEQKSPKLIDKVQNVTNQTMGSNHDWTDLSAKALGLDDVGTDPNKVVSKINSAISTLNGYCGAMSTVLENVWHTSLSGKCGLDLPIISFRV